MQQRSKNTKIITLGTNEYLVVDLTEALSLDQEVYPGDPKPKRIVFSDIHENGWHHYIHELGDHHFHPHGDAPNHQNPDLMDRGFESFGLDHCFNSAFMIDLSEHNRAKEIDGVRFLTEIRLEDLKPYEELLSEKGAVLFRTGYDKWLEANYPHVPELLPYFDLEAAAYLASFKNLKVVGTDSLTVDAPGVQKVHQLLKEKLIVESMVHLHCIPTENRSGFDLQTSPVRIIGATGGPVTAYAYISQ